jgi:hypothetical protein
MSDKDKDIEKILLLLQTIKTKVDTMDLKLLHITKAVDRLDKNR